MNELKFRAWDGHKFIYSFTESGEDRKGWFFTHISIYNLPVQQYIGLNDENDKKIYDGDIILASCGDIYLVKSTLGGWNPFIDNMTTDKSFRYKIVGNINENSELLFGDIK